MTFYTFCARVRLLVMKNGIELYNQRLLEIGKAGFNPSDLTDALKNPLFEREHDNLLLRLALDYRANQPAGSLEPWTTIETGQYGSKEELCDAFSNAGFFLTAEARKMIFSDCWELATSRKWYNVYETSLANLAGLPDSATWIESDKAYGSLDRNGFLEAPDEAALLIRMAAHRHLEVGWASRSTVLSEPKILTTNLKEGCAVRGVLGLSTIQGGARKLVHFDEVDTVSQAGARPKRWSSHQRVFMCKEAD